MLGRTYSFCLACCLASSVAFGNDARAQTSAPTTPTLGPTANKYPERFSSTGEDLGTIGNRSQNLTPLGINHQDCLDDQQLNFEVTVSGFAGQNIEVWATKNGNCSNDGDRGVGGAIPDCWRLNMGQPSVSQTSPASKSFLIRVQDIIGPQAAPSTTYQTYTPQTSAACKTQSSFTSESFAVYLVPTLNGSSQGFNSYSYPLPVDLVGPPPPGGVHHSVGDTLFVLSWTPNSDTDTAGYDVYMDPVPGMEGDAATGEAGLPEPTLECPGGQAPADASAGELRDAGCHLAYGGGSSTTSSCADSLLVGVDAGGQGNGGISTIPTANVVGVSGGNGLTVSDKSASSYPVEGLKDGVEYTAVVAAVDSFGNIGPPSEEQCDFPAPVNDFWQEYRNDGGRAQGFCAVGALGARSRSSRGTVLAIAIGAVAMAARRKRCDVRGVPRED